MRENYRSRESKRRRQQHARMMIIFAICLVATLAYLKSRLWVADLSYEYSNLKKELQKAEQENASLRIEVRHLKSPSRVERIARERLGLRPLADADHSVRVIHTE